MHLCTTTVSSPALPLTGGLSRQASCAPFLTGLCSDDAVTGTIGVTPPLHIIFTGARQPSAEKTRPRSRITEYSDESHRSGSCTLMYLHVRFRVSVITRSCSKLTRYYDTYIVNRILWNNLPMCRVKLKDYSVTASDTTRDVASWEAARKRPRNDFIPS